MIFYNYFVRKNTNVQREYERYVMEHIEEHKKHRLSHWKILCKLNWHYRVKKKTTAMFYPIVDMTQVNDSNMESNTNVSDMANSVLQPAPKPAPKPVPRNPLLPYVDGPESEFFSRPFPHHFIKSLLDFDVISFDIFDTLILRPFEKPTDLFYLLEKKFEQQEFRRIRIECERRARELSILHRGNREVTIEDIYREVEKVTGIDKEYGAKVEFELEKEMCSANPYMKRVFDILKGHGKVIYATSDMYLPKEMMTELLESCGYTGFQEVIVSCEYNVNKHETGALYKVLKNKQPRKSIVHIGDNYKADIEQASANGLETRFYKAVNAVGAEFRADGMSNLIGSAYAGLVNSRIFCGLKKYSVFYEYGYIYGGLYVLGYCNYIANYARMNNYDKVLFVSRDGDIYSQVFNLIYKDISNDYVYWSRMSNIKATIEKDRFSFLNRLVDGKITQGVQVTISALLTSSGLGELIKYLKKYRLNPEEYLSEANRMIIRELLIDHYDEIINIYQKDMKQLEEYYRAVVGDAKSVLIVDVGWTGSNVLGLADMLVEKWGLCERAYGLLAASNGWNSEITTEYDGNSRIQPYIFGRTLNRGHFDGFVRNLKRSGHVFFEILSQSSIPSFGGISEDGKFVFDVPEVENYQIIKEMHKGVVDFAKDYTSKFGNYNIMMSISGYDAYCPFRKLFRNVAYYKNFFSDFVFTTTLFGNQDTQSIETLADFMKTKGL